MFLAATGSPAPALDEWTHPDRAFLLSEKESSLKGSRYVRVASGCDALRCREGRLSSGSADAEERRTGARRRAAIVLCEGTRDPFAVPAALAPAIETLLTATVAVNMSAPAGRRTGWSRCSRTRHLREKHRRTSSRACS